MRRLFFLATVPLLLATVACGPQGSDVVASAATASAAASPSGEGASPGNPLASTTDASEPQNAATSTSPSSTPFREAIEVEETFELTGDGLSTEARIVAQNSKYYLEVAIPREVPQGTELVAAYIDGRLRGKISFHPEAVWGLKLPQAKESIELTVRAETSSGEVLATSDALDIDLRSLGR